ncbi:hypothetical protein KI387_001220 [Taxus chinensis]|uniref:Reverse transcriptase domain-containing protein n=1 Tax=Taxus chinensis TaxID=29808 RepID=A0AA38GUB4_TAXCH|nr:hypothetical protein KI387_001220 [Taxus chinensis]
MQTENNITTNQWLEYSKQLYEQESEKVPPPNIMVKDTLFTNEDIMQEFKKLATDFKKDFDMVPRSKMWNRLEELGVPAHYRATIHRLYEQEKDKIKTHAGLSEGFKSDIGVKQGCPISPTLFGLYIDELEDWINKFRGMATIAQLRCAKVSSLHVPQANRSGFSNGRIAVDFKGSFSSTSLFCKGNHIDATGRGLNVSRIKCTLAEQEPKVEKKTLLHELYEQQGQSPWYDNLRRPVSDLKPLIESGVRGITSNPTIFEKAIISSDAYDAQFRQLINGGKEIEDTYWELVIKDIQDACELFEPIYDQTGGADGYVSVEVSPRLALETEQTIEAAKWLHKRVNHRNVYIKIPATAECIPSIKKVISLGISVNVTLIFSLPRYEAVIDAYLEGLESCEAKDLSKVTSVASFFVSRVDTLIDKRLEKIGTEAALALRGKAATAQAALAYKLYQEKFSGPRWEALEKKGARKQRVLWASTSVKNPAYPDTLYVNPLIGPDSVTTMPDQALQAFMDHGTVSRTIDANFEEAEKIYDAIRKTGIDWDEVGSLLELEGVESFKKSFDSLLSSLGEKANSLKSKS